MDITFYDVTLRMIQESDKELIRYWRNHEKVREKMEFRSYITKEMHNDWFSRMSNFNNAFAFIVEYNNASVGVVYHTNTSEYSNGGMFLWDETCLDSQVPVLVSITLTDLNFYLLKNKCSYINILRDNPKVIEFNRWFGYKLVDEKDSNYNQLYILTEQRYNSRSAKIKQALESYYKQTSVIKLIFYENDLSSGLFDYFKPFLQGVDEQHKNLITYSIVGS